MGTGPPSAHPGVFHVEPHARGMTSTLAIRRRAVPTAHQLVADEKLTPPAGVRRTQGARAPTPSATTPAARSTWNVCHPAGTDPRGRAPPPLPPRGRTPHTAPRADAHCAPHPCADARRTPRGRTPHAARATAVSGAITPCTLPQASLRMRRCAKAQTVPRAPPSPRPTAVDVPGVRRAMSPLTPGTASGSTTCDPEHDPPRLAAPARRRGAGRPLQGLARSRSAAAHVGFNGEARRMSTGRRTATPDTSPSSPVQPRARHRLHECIPVRCSAGRRSTREGGRPEPVSREPVGQVPAESAQAPRTAPGPIASSPRDRRVASRSVGHTDLSRVHTPTSTC
jgi:hypothetical protein